MKKILVQAIKLVIPSKQTQTKISNNAKQAFILVSKEIEKYPEITDVEFGGSYSKGTWLPESTDIDIFIKFKKSTSEKKFTEIAKKVGFQSLRNFKPYVRYSDHPYVEAAIGKTKINVVPCYKVSKGKWQSAADRSPYHTEFMLESLSGQMKNEVRLLKSFLRSLRIYGAEIAIQGFSGYVAEVLIWNFGSFESVIKSMASLRQGQVIGKSSKSFDTPVVIIDPVDSNRNLAAAISDENVGKFILACRSFLQTPSISFFKSKSRKTSKNNLENVLAIQFNFKTRSPDIIEGQVKKAGNALSVQLELNGFRVLRNNASTHDNKANLLFLMHSLEIPTNQVKQGPEFFNASDSKNFIQKNIKKSKLLWIGKNMRVFSLENRKISDAKNFLNNVLKNQLNSSGVPKGLTADIKNGFKIITGNKVSSKSIKEAISELVSTDEAFFSSN